MLCRTFLVFGLVLIGITPATAPARPKRPDETQEAYAREILKRKDIKSYPSNELPEVNQNMPKYILTDDAATLEAFLKNGGFVKKFAETWVKTVEDNTAFRLTVQNHWNNLLLCVQRIRVYEELETPQEMEKRLATERKNQQASPEALGEKNHRRKFSDVPREDILAKCEGGYAVRTHSRYRFGFADAIYFYGAKRIIYKIQDSNLAKTGGFLCHEHIAGSKKEKLLSEQLCKNRVERIFTWQGTVRNLLWNLFNRPMHFFRGHAFKE